MYIRRGKTAIGLEGLSAAYLHSLRTGVQQDVTVDARHAVLEFRQRVCLFSKQTSYCW